MEAMSIGKLARETGIKTGTILYYEKRGLVPKASRSDSGYRLFSHAYIERITFIKNAKSMGFTLSEILELLHMVYSKTTCKKIRQFAEKKINNKVACIQECKQSIVTLQKIISKCSMGKKRIDKSCLFYRAIFSKDNL